ncbi:TonB-dependent receptor [Zunongwangia sp. HRR-M8]|uniref:TonB-dependent receptor n=1 Tax=Zunongwangia sp. HRR-M8 TaxID=3015170 RepID=UPI0022DD002E|nr:TonB-dependent receptor [Zunongwangia sp. HRR-M8]WBL21113.1 TonB-dependent receptor [Zunongwangia sp. HRR-M8]
MQKFYSLCVLFFFCYISYAQNGVKLQGKITTEDGEPITGANITVPEISKGTTSDYSGDYQIQAIDKGTYTIKVSFIGYRTLTKEVTLNTNTTLNFKLEESAFELEGLVVTAQKREQKNKDVPIAITSYGNEFLQKQNVQEFDQLSEFVPGLQIQLQSANNPGIVIRGITSDNGDSRVEPRVSVFQNGVSISKSRGSVVELYDIDRVEVLKGPQGTLFGRGAEIGAMHIINNTAKNENAGKLTLGYGNFNQFRATGYVNTPLVKDKLFVRLAGIYSKRDGFIDNLSGGDLNGKETLAFRGSLKYMIGMNTTLDVIANWQHDTPPGTAFKSGTYAPVGGDTNPTHFADLERGKELGLDRTVYDITANLKHHINENWDFTSITAYREFDSDEAFDADGTAAPALFFHEIAKGKQFSQEVRFNFSADDKLHGFFGGNFFFEDGSQAAPLITNEQSYGALILSYLTGNQDLFMVDGVPQFFPAIPNDPDTFGQAAGAPLNEANRESYTNYGKNYSGDIFADVSYSVIPSLSFTLGLRGTWENINAGYEVEDAETPSFIGALLSTYPNNLFAPTNGRLEASENFLSTVGRFAVNFEASKQLSLFGNIARGRRPNVINIDETGANTLAAESVWSYEVGAKSLFLNNRLQFDVNAYTYKYRHFQTSITTFDPETGINTNPDDSGSATSYGFETAFQYAFARNSNFFANYSYIDASFDDEDENGNEQELAGNTFRLTPKHSFSLGVNYQPSITKNMDLYVRPSYSYKSKVFFEETNKPGVSQDAYGLLNFKVGTIINKKYEVNFFMNNVLDEEYIIDGGNTGGGFGIPTFIAGAPRFYGVQASVKF